VDFGRLPRSMSSVNWFQTQCRRSLPSGVSTFAGAARLGLRRLDAAFGFSPLSCGASQPSHPLPSDLNKTKLSDQARSIGYRKAPDATHVKAASSRRTPRLACGGQGRLHRPRKTLVFLSFRQPTQEVSFSWASLKVILRRTSHHGRLAQRTSSPGWGGTLERSLRTSSARRPWHFRRAS